MIDPEEFAIWRDNPITQAVFKALQAKADEAKEAWVTASWERGDLRPEFLADTRASAQSWQYVIDLTAEEVDAVLAKD